MGLCIPRALSKCWTGRAVPRQSPDWTADPDGARTPGSGRVPTAQTQGLSRVGQVSLPGGCGGMRDRSREPGGVGLTEEVVQDEPIKHVLLQAADHDVLGQEGGIDPLHQHLQSQGTAVG